MGSTENFFKEKKKWSILKDIVLDYYLKPYIIKLLSAGRPLVIIDCFAGKGRFEDGNIGSPMLIIKQIEEVLNNSKIENKEIYAFFIEKKYAEELCANIGGFTNCSVLSCSYESFVEKELLVKFNKGVSIFLYIDPYGVKSLDFKYLRRISEAGFSSVEMLLNLNSFGFLREGSRLLKYVCPNENSEEIDYELEDKNSISHMNKVAGGSYWQKILAERSENLIDMKTAECCFMEEYSKKVRDIFQYSVNIPIKTKISNLPKYRLIFGTNHIDGLFLMVNNMNKVWFKITQEERDGQGILFKEFDSPDLHSDKDFNLRDEIRNILTIKGNIELQNLYVNLIENFGIMFSIKDYKNTLKSMEKKEIKIKRKPSLTPTGRISTSWDYKKYKIKVNLR